MFLNPHDEYKNKTVSFISTDSEDLFRKNRKIQDSSWIYRRKTISYTHNELGFRTKSFENLDWNNSIVVFGCSNVYGTGIDNSDCFCNLIEMLTGTNVINFGIHGGSVEIAFYNSLILHNNFPTPKAVVQFWTSMDRYTNITENEIKNFVPTHRDYEYRINWSNKSIYYALADRTLWKNKTVYYEASHWTDTADAFEIDYLPEIVDVARDLSHPGIETNKRLATFLIEKLEDRGLKF